ncbi:MAG TPA: alpha/beta hydrolase [Longimicrobiaceae bacterium]|jgi:alpha-beta hydrolase superfamily lysophospholipase|nr:alpha/beta hydrolase [Longimicrobiaceae bacterium]
MNEAPGPAAEVRTGAFAVSGGLRLHWQAWDADAPRAVLLVSHGLGEHGGRYAPLALGLARQGISTYAVDHRGHGLSEGRQAHVRRFSDFTDDFEAFRLAVQPELPSGVPVFLLGHSLGGLIALRYLQTHTDTPLRGAVLSSPALALHNAVPWWKKAGAPLLNVVAPALKLHNEIDPSVLSHDAEYVASYRRDPLVHSWITPRLYAEINRAMALALAEGGALRLPLLFVIPGADPVVRPAVTGAFARGLDGDVTVEVFPEMYHEAFNEVGGERVMADVAAWILARAG